MPPPLLRPSPLRSDRDKAERHIQEFIRLKMLPALRMKRRPGRGAPSRRLARQSSSGGGMSSVSRGASHVDDDDDDDDDEPAGRGAAPAHAHARGFSERAQPLRAPTVVVIPSPTSSGPDRQPLLEGAPSEEH